MESGNKVGKLDIGLPLILGWMMCIVGWSQFSAGWFRMRNLQMVQFDMKVGLPWFALFLFNPYANSLVLTSLVGIALQRKEKGSVAFVKVIPWLAAVLAAVQMTAFVCMSATPYGSTVAPEYFVTSGIAAAAGIVGWHLLLLKWKKWNDARA